MPPALQYYFDSKEGLHRACGQFIIDISTQGFALALEKAESILAKGGVQDAANALCDVLDILLDAALFARGSPDWERFAARIQSERDSPAGALVQRLIAEPLRDICARLVAHATGSPLNDAARLKAIAIIGQVSAFHVYREGSLQLLGWPDFNGPRRDTIKAVLRAHTRAALAIGHEWRPVTMASTGQGPVADSFPSSRAKRSGDPGPRRPDAISRFENRGAVTDRLGPGFASRPGMTV